LVVCSGLAVALFVGRLAHLGDDVGEEAPTDEMPMLDEYDSMALLQRKHTPRPTIAPSSAGSGRGRGGARPPPGGPAPPPQPPPSEPAATAAVAAATAAAGAQATVVAVTEPPRRAGPRGGGLRGGGGGGRSGDRRLGGTGSSLAHVAKSLGRIAARSGEGPAYTLAIFVLLAVVLLGAVAFALMSTVTDDTAISQRRSARPPLVAAAGAALPPPPELGGPPPPPPPTFAGGRPSSSSSAFAAARLPAAEGGRAVLLAAGGGARGLGGVGAYRLAGGSGGGTAILAGRPRWAEKASTGIQWRKEGNSLGANGVGRDAHREELPPPTLLAVPPPETDGFGALSDSLPPLCPRLVLPDYESCFLVPVRALANGGGAFNIVGREGNGLLRGAVRKCMDGTLLELFHASPDARPLVQVCPRPAALDPTAAGSFGTCDSIGGAPAPSASPSFSSRLDLEAPGPGGATAATAWAAMEIRGSGCALYGTLERNGSNAPQYSVLRAGRTVMRLSADSSAGPPRYEFSAESDQGRLLAFVTHNVSTEHLEFSVQPGVDPVLVLACVLTAVLFG